MPSIVTRKSWNTNLRDDICVRWIRLHRARGALHVHEAHTQIGIRSGRERAWLTQRTDVIDQ